MQRFGVRDRVAVYHEDVRVEPWGDPPLPVAQSARRSVPGRDGAQRLRLAGAEGAQQGLGLRAALVSTYAQPPATASGRGRLDEADGWYRRSLAITEELDDRPTTALTFAAVGLLAEDQDKPSLALAWYIRCVTLFSEAIAALAWTIYSYQRHHTPDPAT